jgi:membrane fusion protein (multidrug efflux system)
MTAALFRRVQRRVQPARRIALLVAAVALTAMLAWAGHLWWYAHTHVTTDDAYVAAHVAPISARVSGTVREVLVDDNQDVKAGDVLVRLDPRDYEVAVAQARAAVEMARSDLRNASLNVPLTADTTRSLLDQASAALGAARHGAEMARHDLEERRSELRAKQAAVAAAQAAVRAAEADWSRAHTDFDRTRKLYQVELVARQDVDHAEAADKSAAAALDAAKERLAQARSETMQMEASVRSQEAAVAQAQRRVDEARAAAANADAQRRQVSVREAMVEAAKAKVAQTEAALRQAELNLGYAEIRAPIGGRVTRKNVEPGQVLQPGQAVLSIVDLDNVWVVANYKETQLTKVRPGQRATITVDTYPGVVFDAHVASIQAGSGAVFSLLPPENASGNFVKVVQRVPVKLIVDGGQARRHLLVPGMSVIPAIDLRHRD